MAERTKALVSKTSMGAIPSWVRIPPSPQLSRRAALRGVERNLVQSLGPASELQGEVLEWPNRHDWKSCVAFTGDRGFESHPLRSLLYESFWRLRDARSGSALVRSTTQP